MLVMTALSAAPATGSPHPGMNHAVRNNPLGPQFHLRVDPNHPNEAIRNYGYLTEMKNLEGGYYGRKNLIFDNLPSSTVPLEDHVPRNSTDSSDRPARFIGAFADTWWYSPTSEDRQSVVDATETPEQVKSANGRDHFRLLPGILQGNRIGAWNDWYYPKQDKLDFSERNQYYQLSRGSGSHAGGKGDLYACTNMYSDSGACWLQTGFTVSDTVSESGEEKHRFGYTGRWENMWSLCRLHASSSYNDDTAFYYSLRLVGGKKLENCSEPFALEVEYIK